MKFLGNLRLFESFKYLVYLALMVNVFLFLVQDWASADLYRSGLPLEDVIATFAVSIDTLAWLLLLLLFELETYQIPDEKLTPRLMGVLLLMRTICYCSIVYAFYGYIVKTLGFSGYELAPVYEPCKDAVGKLVLLKDLDEYSPITAATCSAIKDSALYINPGINALATETTLRDSILLAWLDVINAGTWILVVVFLELDVWLLRRGWIGGLIEKFSNISKYLIYSVLVLIALYWGVFSTFLNFWDAFLWIVAFVFIERNVIEWERELEEAESHVNKSTE